MRVTTEGISEQGDSA